MASRQGRLRATTRQTAGEMVMGSIEQTVETVVLQRSTFYEKSSYTQSYTHLALLTCCLYGMHQILVRPFDRLQSVLIEGRRQLRGRGVALVHADHAFATLEALGNFPLDPFALGAIFGQVHRRDGHPVDALADSLLDVVLVLALDGLRQGEVIKLKFGLLIRGLPPQEIHLVLVLEGKADEDMPARIGGRVLE